MEKTVAWNPEVLLQENKTVKAFGKLSPCSMWQLASYVFVFTSPNCTFNTETCLFPQQLDWKLMINNKKYPPPLLNVDITRFEDLHDTGILLTFWGTCSNLCNLCVFPILNWWGLESTVSHFPLLYLFLGCRTWDVGCRTWKRKSQGKLWLTLKNLHEAFTCYVDLSSMWAKREVTARKIYPRK